MTESEAIKILQRDLEIQVKNNALTDGIEAVKFAIQALEKQIPKKPKHTYIKHGKHIWKKDKSGEIDDFAWDFNYCNGVVCEVCGATVCVHCNPDYMELDDCEEEHWSCPSCEKEVYRNTRYCDCGQRLDWSDKK